MLTALPEVAPWLKHDFISLAHEHQEPRANAMNGGPWTTWPAF